MHPRMISTEVLAFVQVALTEHISSSIQDILGEDTSAEDQYPRTCAIFYSISSTQRGLSGIDLGKSLIKAAVQELQQEFKTVKTFSTLSPIPGLRKWLESIAEKALLLKQLNLPPDSIDRIHDIPPLNSVEHEENKRILSVLCARYLFHEKRKRQVLDPVGECENIFLLPSLTAPH